MFCFKMSSKLFKYGLFFGCVPTPLLLALHPWTHHKYDTAKSDQQGSYNNFAPYNSQLVAGRPQNETNKSSLNNKGIQIIQKCYIFALQ